MPNFVETAWRGDDFTFTTAGATGGSSWAVGDTLSLEPLTNNVSSVPFSFQLDANAESRNLVIQDDDATLDDVGLDNSQQNALNDPFGDHGDLPGGVQARFAFEVTDTVTGETFNIYIVFIGGQGPYLNGGFDQDVLILSEQPLVSGRVYDVATNGIDVDASVSYEALVCFASGAMIATPEGAKRVEDIAIGDLVDTADHGPQEVRWVGRRRVAAKGAFAPVVISEGMLGANAPLRVSPQHRLLLTGWRAELLFGASEVLVAAKHLVDGEGVYVAEGGDVEYHHILFDRHEIVYANGVRSESFQPGSMWLDTTSAETRDEVLTLFPELANDQAAMAAARPTLRAYEAAAARA